MSPKTRRLIAGAVALCLAGTLLYVFIEGDPSGQASGDEIEAEGEITRIDPIFSSSKDNQFEIVVEFTDPESGQTYAAKDTVTSDPEGGEQSSQAAGIALGDTRTVAYDPADPSDNRVLNEPAPKVLILGLGIAALVFAIASFAGFDAIGFASRFSNKHDV